MTDLHVDRLTLRVGGLSADDGHRLVRLVAASLATLEVAGAAQSIARLRVDVAPHHGETLEAMAHRIARELVLTLMRSS